MWIAAACEDSRPPEAPVVVMSKSMEKSRLMSNPIEQPHKSKSKPKLISFMSVSVISPDQFVPDSW